MDILYRIHDCNILLYIKYIFLKKQEKSKESKRQYLMAIIFALIAIFGFPALIILYEKIENVLLNGIQFMAMGGVILLSLLPIAVVSTYASFELKK